VRAQLDEKQVPAFLPTQTKWSRWKDRRKQIDVPLFPGYVFAQFDPDARLAVLKCTGVVSIVSVNGAPVKTVSETGLKAGGTICCGADLQVGPRRR